MEQPTLHRLEGISPRAFQHPADKAATEALAQIPGDKASEYYVNKTWNIYRDASDATQGFRDKVDGWLKRDGEPEEPEEAEDPR